MKINRGTNLSKIVLVSAILLMLLVCIAPASAGTFFSNNNNTYASVSNDLGARFDIFNDETYYFNFTKPTGGLKAIHITDDYTDMDGDVYASQGSSGTFYISDTSTDTQYHDDAILMFAIPLADYNYEISNGDEDLSLTVTASGYQWTPTGDGLKPSNPGSYQSNFYSETFELSDFLGGSEYWRPAGLDEYPVYYGQTTTDPFKFMCIDLNLGTLNDNTLTNYGAVKVDYIISDYEGNAVFDAYAYCNQSAQGQGVSWTNKGSSSGSSGWTIGF